MEKQSLPIGGLRFVDRGDLASYDFTTPDFITDGNEHDLDLSHIVETGASAVLLGTSVYDERPDTFITFKKKENLNNINIALTAVIIKNVVTYLDLICPIGPSKKLTYKATNTAWTWIYLFVKAWWI
jgi:hypothetical protein